MQYILFSCFLIFSALSLNFNYANGQTTFSVLDFGAIGDGKTDDSQAFLKAWKAACGANRRVVTPTLLVPTQKTFLLQPTTFAGPCNSSSVQVQIMGNIVAPSDPNDWKKCEMESWLVFTEVENLSIGGSGQIDGQGSSWWSSISAPSNFLNGSKTHSKRPKALLISKCSNLQLSGLTHSNSPKAHIGIRECNFSKIFNLRIKAPEDSPNTDGIDIYESTNVTIQDSIIGTGDDCIAISRGSSFINITNITCGPGHGISVGSLGANGAFETVENVHVHHCSFNGTQNGARIKTWEGGSGYARKISFEHITLIEAKNPIIIDQHYCNGQHSCPTLNKTTAVKISEVTYNGFQGTCANGKGITLDCTTPGCFNIAMNQINITSLIPGKPVFAKCTNVNGTSTSTVPNVPCLTG